MKIGELAQRAQVNIDTVRYYERQGLLPAPQRLASGYRLYDQDDVARLRFVRRAKTLGFTLLEIRELLALSSHRADDMAGMKAAAIEKLTDVETKLAELTRIRNGLKTLVASCPGHGALEQCPILNALGPIACIPIAPTLFLGPHDRGSCRLSLVSPSPTNCAWVDPEPLPARFPSPTAGTGHFLSLGSN